MSETDFLRKQWAEQRNTINSLEAEIVWLRAQNNNLRDIIEKERDITSGWRRAFQGNEKQLVERDARYEKLKSSLWQYQRPKKLEGTPLEGLTPYGIACTLEKGES